MRIELQNKMRQNGNSFHTNIIQDCHEFYRKFKTYAEVENVRIENNEESRHSKVQYSMNWEV